MNRRIYLLFFLLFPLAAVAGPYLRQAKENIKKGSNLEQTAQNLFAEALKPETTIPDRVECYRLAAECSKKLNAAENLKLYLHQPYDTVRFFSTVIDMYDRMFMADSVSMRPNERGKVKILNRKQSRAWLMPYRSYIVAGGKWYYAKGRYAEAYNYLSRYITVAQHPIFESEHLLQTDTLMPTVAYLAVASAHETGNAQGVIRYAELAKKANMQSDVIHEYTSRAWLSMGDTARWVKSLWQGLNDYPSHPYFFTNLIDHLAATQQLDLGLAVADSLTHREPAMPIFWYAKASILMRQQREADAIVACDSCLARDPDYAEALYTKGLAALNLAVIAEKQATTDLTAPNYQSEQDHIAALYRLAMQPMQRVRELLPEAQERWVEPLYRIYLHLNMGAEFEEMESLLQ